jgi:hypothetical protein
MVSDHHFDIFKLFSLKVNNICLTSSLNILLLAAVAVFFFFFSFGFAAGTSAKMSVSSLNKSSSFVLALFVFFFTVLDGNISSSCKANIVYFQREKFENIKVVIRNHISQKQ